MIPSRYDYYMRRVREHRSLARGAQNQEDRQKHDQLVAAYRTLARKYRLRQTVSVCAQA